jgi:hypothetical protein
MYRRSYSQDSAISRNRRFTGERRQFISESSFKEWAKMSMNGMGMMLKSLGIDPDELKRNVEEFMSVVKASLQKVDANQARIETKLDSILTRLDGLAPEPSTTEIMANGAASGILITNEKFPRQMMDEAQATPPREQGQV